MSDFGNYYGSQNEAVHSALFGIHDDIYQRALVKIRAALMALHTIEGKDSGEVRVQCRAYIAELEGLRASLESVGRESADLRTRILRENGCDGTCRS